MIAEDKDPAVIVEERGLRQVSEIGAIEAVVDAVLSAHPVQVEQYHAGKKGVIGFLVGRCMQATEGQGNPKLISETLERRLDAT